MPDPIENKVQNWLLQEIDDEERHEIRRTNQIINFLEEYLFRSYLLTSGPGPSFWERLSLWLENAGPDDAQKAFFKLITHLFYVGPKEMESLYRAAYNGPIARWLITETKLMLDDDSAEKKLKGALSETWFCPITDSLRINDFYKVNCIPGRRKFRPHFDELYETCRGNPETITDYVKKPSRNDSPVKRLVLVEDNICSGSQMSDYVAFAAKTLPHIPILVVPLMICPEGLKACSELVESYDNLTFVPLMELDSATFIQCPPNIREQSVFPAIRKLAISLYEETSGGISIEEDWKRPYGPFGFNHTGGLVVLYTNTLSNTMPIIHSSAGSWEPIFPRQPRG